MFDFSTLKRPSSPNTALYADEGDTSSTADKPALRLQHPPAVVIAAWDGIVRAAARTDVVLSDPERGIHHAVQRSRIFRFPDDIHAEARPLEGGGTRLLVYSASRVGRSDLGVNGKRLAAWTKELETALSRR